MQFDVPRQIGAVSRVVGVREHLGRPARVIVARRGYDTTMEDLWDALTSAERIPRWFLPITGELELGGRYQLEGNAGGEITRCEAPRHLAVTWEYGGEVSWVDVRLTADPAGGTLLELEHLAHVPDGMWNEYGPGAAGVGWDQALLGLARHLATGHAADPSAAAAWAASAEGREFVRRSSDDWCRASIAAGTDAASARAAAERTTAFYTGAGGDSPGEAEPVG